MRTTTPFHLRSAAPTELHGVAAIYHTVWLATQAHLQPRAVAEFRTPDFFRDRMANLPQPPLVADQDGRLLGFAGWEGDHIGQLYVTDGARNAGIGQGLLTASEQAIRGRGFTSANLDCLLGNDAGRRFYERLGWTVEATIVEELATATGTVSVACWRMMKRL